EVQHRVGAMLGQQARDERAVADVTMDEDVVGVAVEVPERLEVAGVRERVEVDHAHAVRHGLPHEVATDETGTAGHSPGWHGTSCVLWAERAPGGLAPGLQNGMSSSGKSSTGAGWRLGADCWRGSWRCGRERS